MRVPEKLSILQGTTSTEDVEFSVISPINSEIRFELRDEKANILKPEKMLVLKRDFSKYQIYKILFQKKPDTDYNLYAFHLDKVIDQRLVGSGPKKNSENNLIILSNSGDFKRKDEKIWKEIFKKNPDYLFFLGNNFQIDHEQIFSDEDLWNSYVESRLTLPLYFHEKLIPTIAIWNDHDYGMKNGNENFLLKNISLETFQSFWAQSLNEDNWISGPGTSGSLNLGDFNFYFLDNRFYRSSPGPGSHLGESQEEWLFKEMNLNNNPGLLIKGDQFFGGYHSEGSFESHHSKNFFQFIDKLNLLETPFVFLSAGPTGSEIMQFPRSLFKRPSFEISTGPLHTPLTTTTNQNNPWLVIKENRRNNFLFLSQFTQDNHWFIEVEAIGENGEVYFKRDLAVYIKDLQNNLTEARKKRRSGRRRFKRRMLKK
jgi:hypothetical protein